MTSEIWRALRTMAASSAAGGLVAGGLVWWARTTPRAGVAAQLALTAALAIFTALLALDTRRIARQRLRLERERLELERQQLERLEKLRPLLQLPTHCFSCGVPLAGGATAHKPGCEILALIEQFFPPVQAIDRKDWLQ